MTPMNAFRIFCVNLGSVESIFGSRVRKTPKRNPPFRNRPKLISPICIAVRTFGSAKNSFCGFQQLRKVRYHCIPPFRRGFHPWYHRCPCVHGLFSPGTGRVAQLRELSKDGPDGPDGSTPHRTNHRRLTSCSPLGIGSLDPGCWSTGRSPRSVEWRTAILPCTIKIHMNRGENPQANDANLTPL